MSKRNRKPKKQNGFTLGTLISIYGIPSFIKPTLTVDLNSVPTEPAGSEDVREST